MLRRLSSLAGLKRWRDALIHRTALVHGGYGCVLGPLAHELADGEDDVRVNLAADFAAREQLLAEGFDRMRGAGALRADADLRPAHRRHRRGLLIFQNAPAKSRWDADELARVGVAGGDLCFDPVARVAIEGSFSPPWVSPHHVDLHAPQPGRGGRGEQLPTP